MIAARDAAARFIADMSVGHEPYWLTLLGVPGTGKTFLAKQTFEQTRPYNPGNSALWIGPKHRPYCMWLDASRFGERMKDGEYNLPETLTDDWCICLDDLGAQRDKSDFIADGIYRLCLRRVGKWTIFTSNLTLDEISARVDDRVASRLVRDENKVVTLDCGDYALRRP